MHFGLYAKIRGLPHSLHGHPGARNRRQHRYVQRVEWDSVSAASLSIAGSSRDAMDGTSQSERSRG
jgi:hypothetical protein